MIRKSMAVVLAVGMILGLTACGDTSDSGKSLSASASVSKTESKAENITADRTIAVEEISGTVTASDDAETFNLVKGEHLKSGREVATKEKSYLTLLLDSDKHVYAAELTRFELLAEGGLKSTRTVLSLMEGTLRSVIDNKLEPGESYEVTTPNASMAVRGTDFTVTVAQFNGAYVTTVKVDEGVVDVKANIGAEEITRELNPGDGLKIGDTGVKEFKEGSRRKLLKKTESNYAGGELMHYNIYTYSYDDNGFLLKEEIDSSAPFTTPSWYEYLNDVDGNIIRKTLVYEGFGPDYYTEYEYDALGNMIRAVDRFAADESPIIEYVYTYDRNSNKIEEACPTDDPEVTPYRIKYTYDADGHMLESVKTKLDDSAVLEREVRTYDDQGRITSCLKYDRDGAVYEEWANIRYDDRGNMTSRDQKGFSDYINHIELEYDDEDNLIKRTEVGSNGYSTVETYEYSE